jgi:AraC family transcriptional regulator of adaptative response/methylated-DNA-[protein]-cysteine methyltransferase
MSTSIPRDDDDAARWAAVQARDWRRDGTFVYAVTSTGVYCRPSCPSRRPSRANVRFFEQPAAAEQAGFRACRRCAPRERVTSDVRAVERARDWIDAHPGEPVRLASLARVAGLSSFHLQRTFKRLVGLTPREYAAAHRHQALRRTLRDARDVTDAIYEAGYSSPSRAYNQAGEALGMTPGAFRRGADGVEIFFDIASSQAGLLLVAATQRGLCFVAFGETENALEQRVAAEFPRAAIQRAPDRLRAWVEELVRRVADGRSRVELPLDVRATAFQRQVWRALTRIPPGESRSYAQVATAVGRPSAARAVAQACASNPVAVAIPCHRVVRTGGQAGGYRWGPERKTTLLEAERAARDAGARYDPDPV